MHAGLKPRDVALAKSLNEDKLSQLFVKVDESTLDARLVSPHTHADLPSEARSLLVLKRGTGSETNQGLLLGAIALPGPGVWCANVLVPHTMPAKCF